MSLISSYEFMNCDTEIELFNKLLQYASVYFYIHNLKDKLLIN